MDLFCWSKAISLMHTCFLYRKKQELQKEKIDQLKALYLNKAFDNDEKNIISDDNLKYTKWKH